MPLVSLFSGSITRTWDVRDASGKNHVVTLHHHTVSGARHLVVDDTEVFGSRGSSSVLGLGAAGHIIPFRAASDPGVVKILPAGAGGFTYHCFVNDARVMERGEAAAATEFCDPFVTVTVPTSEVQPDPTGEPVVFYRMDVMAETRGTSSHKRFSYVGKAGTRFCADRGSYGHSDFFALHEQLRSAYKGSPLLERLPAVPNRSFKLMEDHRSPAFVQKRRLALQRYMGRLARLDFLRTNKSLLRFLGLDASDGGLRDRSEVVVGFPAGPMGLTLRAGTRVGEPAEIVGFKPLPDGSEGPAAASGRLHVGDVLCAVDGESVLQMSYSDAIGKIRSRPRPVRLHFLSMAADSTADGAGAGAGAGAGGLGAGAGAREAPSPVRVSGAGGVQPMTPSPARLPADPSTPVAMQPMRRPSHPADEKKGAPATPPRAASPGPVGSPAGPGVADSSVVIASPPSKGDAAGDGPAGADMDPIADSLFLTPGGAADDGATPAADLLFPDL